MPLLQNNGVLLDSRVSVTAPLWDEAPAHQGNLQSYASPPLGIRLHVDEIPTKNVSCQSTNTDDNNKMSTIKTVVLFLLVMNRLAVALN